jgi:methylated-DNA-[protein]-cysteine S-methyltransferase
MTHYYTYIKTLQGNILLISDGNVLTGLYFENQKHMPPIDSCWQQNVTLTLFSRVETQLAEYFQGRRQTFEIPYSLKTGTGFQQKVWGALSEIPCGNVLSYRQLAEHIGAPKSIRAVASATGRNPISLIIPCHRIIGSDGSLVGYAGGLERKQALLEIEKNARL